MSDFDSRKYFPKISRRQMLYRSGAFALALTSASILEACGDITSTPLASTTSASASNSTVSSTVGTTTSASSTNLTGVRMACWSQPLSEQANIYAAQEYGWFKEQGLNFTFVPGAGGGDALKNLLAGNADFAFTNVEPLLFAIQEGAKLRAVYNIYPQNVFNLISLKSANITKITDLKGKQVGVYSQSSGTRYNLMVMLRSVGLKESDVEEVAAGVENFAPLKENKLAATVATDTGLYSAEQAGLGDVNVIWARDILNTPSDVFVITEDTYQKKKDYITSFLKAYKKGSQWMLDNPDKAAQLTVKYATDGKDISRNKAIIDIRNQSTVSSDTKANGLGHFDMDLLKKVESTFYDLSITKQHFDMEKIFTNEFITSI